MKPKETLLNSLQSDLTNDEDNRLEHNPESYETPLRADAFEMKDSLKIDLIEKHFREIMNILGLDLNNDSLNGTPKRVAKMYVREIFSGLNPKNKPKIKLFGNNYNYGEMLVEKDITFYSSCEHHFVPIIGKAHVGYFSGGKIIGLSKINRIVQYYARRPQVQERLSVQITMELMNSLETKDVGVVIDATHLCVSSRGVGDTNSTTGTAHFNGKFRDKEVKKEFLDFINTN